MAGVVGVALRGFGKAYFLFIRLFFENSIKNRIDAFSMIS